MVDRFDKRKLMVAADLSRMSLLTGVVMFPSAPALYIFAVLDSLAAVFFDPARSASLPAVLPPGELAAANGLDQIMRNLTMVGGPVVGALLCSRIGLTTALSVDALSFLVSAALLWSTHIPPPRGVSRVPPGVWSGSKAGVKHLWGTPVLRQVSILWFLSTLAVGMWMPLAPFFNRDLRAGDEALGYQIAALGIGGALGGAAAGATCRRWKPGPLLFAAMLLEGLHFILFSLAPNASWSILVLLPWGVVVGIIFVTAETLLQTRADPSMLGRVMSTVKQGEHLASLGSMAAAIALSGAFSAHHIFRVAGLFYIAAVAVTIPTRAGRSLLLAAHLEETPGQSSGDRGDHHDELEPEGLHVVVDR
jgi:MFS family permease